jgi:glycosyltransferase involved in cell wall biosynthesis
MTVLVVGLNRFNSPSGVCISIRNFIQCLQEIISVEEVVLIIGAWQSQYYVKTLSVLENSKVRLKVIDIPNNSFSRNKWFFVGLNKIVNPCDVVLLGYPIPALRLKKPTITVLHDLYPFDYPRNFGFPNFLLNQLLFLVNLFATDSFICVSKATETSLKRRFSSFLMAKKVINIYNYVPFKEVASSVRVLQNRYWLCVAQHRKNKNIEIVVEAFREFQTEQADSELVIVGSEGPETAKLKALIAKYDLGSKVHFLRNISDESLINLYEHASIIISASSIEGFGLPLIEGCYYGKRNVATKIPVYEELVKFVPLFSLEKTPVKNLLAVVNEALSVSYVKPLLNPALSKQVITEQLESVILATNQSFNS